MMNILLSFLKSITHIQLRIYGFIIMLFAICTACELIAFIYLLFK